MLCFLRKKKHKKFNSSHFKRVIRSNHTQYTKYVLNYLYKLPFSPKYGPVRGKGEKGSEEEAKREGERERERDEKEKEKGR